MPDVKECPDCGNAPSQPGIVGALCHHVCHHDCHYPSRHLMEPDPNAPAPSLTDTLWYLAAFAAVFLLLLVAFAH